MALWRSLNCKVREPDKSSIHPLQLPGKVREKRKAGGHAVSREVGGSHGEQWVIRGRLWKSGCKQVVGQELHNEPSARAARAPGQVDAAL